MNAPAPEPHSKASAGKLNFVLISVFLDMLGIGLIVPVMPVLVGQFVPGRDEQALWYGILAAVFGLLQFLFMPMIGAVSDRIGRRPVLLYSMGGMSLSFLVTAWAPSLAWLFVGRAIGGVSAASMSAAMAYASDVSTPDNRARSFGRIGAAFGAGFICGPVLGGLLGEISLALPFWVAGGLAAANLVYGALFVPESLPPGPRAPFDRSRINPLRALRRLLARRAIRPLVLVFALATFAQMMTQGTWVLYTTFRFGWTPRDNGIAMFCVGLATVVVQASLLAILIRRFGEAPGGAGPGIRGAHLPAVRARHPGLDDVSLHLLQPAGLCRRAGAAGAHLARNRSCRTGRADGFTAIDQQPRRGRDAAAGRGDPG
jgi:DHA1 family tetracycline resistance protein-like MFS transporter